MIYRETKFKTSYFFLAVRDKSLRNLRIKAFDRIEATEKMKQKYPEWSVIYQANH